MINVLFGKGPFINYLVGAACIGTKLFDPPPKMGPLIGTLIHAYTYYGDSCAYLIILNTLTCKHSIIE